MVDEVDADQQFFDSGGEVAPEAEVVEVTPEVTPEPVTEPVPEAEKMVPLAALHEARAINKDLKQQITGSNDKINTLEQTFQQFVSKSQQDQDYDVDPDAARDSRIAQLESDKQQNDQHQRNLNEYQQVMNQGRNQIAQYSQTSPEVNEAYTFYNTSRQQELAAIGWSQDEISKQILSDEFHLVVKSSEAGVNPGERIMALANSRGFVGTKKVEAEAEIKQLDQGLNASSTLANSGGQSAGGLTLEALAEMNGAEFDKAWSQLIG